MGDHIVLLVTEEAAATENKTVSSNSENMVTDVCGNRMMDILLPKKLAECRICHDEDEYSNMETPCACCGSLKYAHRSCVQRWCNEKGNTECEICLQPFKPGYTSPPPLFHCDGVPMNFRGNWEISRHDLYNLRFSATGSTDHYEPEFDEYITLSSKSLICCRVVAIIFMTLLVLRHTLPIIINGTGGYTVTLFTFVMLRSIGVLLSIYIMIRAFGAVQRREHWQDHNGYIVPSDEENNLAESEARRPNNLVDLKMKILKDRIEVMGMKERLERICRPSGWDYDSNYKSKHKKQPEYTKTIALICGTSSLSILTGTALLCMFSVMAHLNL